MENQDSLFKFPIMWPVKVPKSFIFMTGTSKVHLPGLPDIRQKNKVPDWFQSSRKEHTTQLFRSSWTVKNHLPVFKKKMFIFSKIEKQDHKNYNHYGFSSLAYFLKSTFILLSLIICCLWNTQFRVQFSICFIFSCTFVLCLNYYNWNQIKCCYFFKKKNQNKQIQGLQNTTANILWAYTIKQMLFQS